MTKTVTREGRIRLALVEGESLFCGNCEEFILGGEDADGTTPEICHAYITIDGLATQDMQVLCSPCIDKLTGPQPGTEEEDVHVEV